MLKDKLIYISGKVLAAILLIALTVMIILFASDRNLPFLSSEEQNYSMFVTASSETVSEDVSYAAAESSDVSEESVDNSETAVSPFEKAISSFGVSAPATPSYEIFDEKKHVLKLIDTTPYVGMTDGSVKLEMGYIITEKDGTTHIYAPNGVDIYPLLGDKTLTFLRDTDGRPLFTDASGKYYFLDENGSIADSDYDAKEDGRGFTCEIPRYLGVQNSEIKRYYKNGRFGYRNSSGIDIVSPMFREAFAFGDDGVGCVLQKYGNTEYLIFYNSKYVTISMEYFPPADRGEDALGYFYFDDGLIRVRRKNSSGDYENLLIDYDARVVTLPSDYELVSYTDSRILLRKGDRYGYMTSRLEWISLPEYASASPFYEGLAVVGNADGKKGVIDRDGNVVVPFVFDYISNCSDGLILAHENQNGWYVFSKNANNS